MNKKREIIFVSNVEIISWGFAIVIGSGFDIFGPTIRVRTEKGSSIGNFFLDVTPGLKLPFFKDVEKTIYFTGLASAERERLEI